MKLLSINDSSGTSYISRHSRGPLYIHHILSILSKYVLLYAKLDSSSTSSFSNFSLFPDNNFVGLQPIYLWKQVIFSILTLINHRICISTTFRHHLKEDFNMSISYVPKTSQLLLEKKISEIQLSKFLIITFQN